MPLGPPQNWPQSLKTIVRVMLDSRYAMWMLWGRELTFFCNDAYLPTVGLKRGWVLGARSDKVWEEIWPDIDDNRDAAESLAMLLTLDGHVVRAAFNGLQALEIAAEFHPHVALLDVGMPKLNGYEVARRAALASGRRTHQSRGGDRFGASCRISASHTAPGSITI